MKSAFWILTTLILITGCSKSVEHPNIIIIMADDLGWGDTGFNGGKKVKTPNLDLLASSGMIFDRFYSASAVCSPTRASVLTGRNPLRMGIPTANAGHMKTEEITIAEILKSKGYSNGFFGKWHLGTFTTKERDANRGRINDSTHLSIPTQHGYDEFFATESKVPTFDPLIKPIQFDTINGESLRYGWRNVTTDSSLNYGTSYWIDRDVKETNNLKGDDSKIIMDRVLTYIEKQKDSPFMATIWFHTPHLPLVTSKAHRQAFKDFGLQEELYYGSILAMDEQMGRLWEKLQNLKIEDNTIILFCSDNGPENRTPGTSGPFRERKRSLYEGGVRVPSFILWKKIISAGGRTSYPSVTSDYLPTIAEIVDFKLDQDRPIDGISLQSIIQGSDTPRKNPIGFIFDKKYSWVTNQYKLISTDDMQTFELYDIIADPSEKNNILSDNSALGEEMKKDLQAWLVTVEQSAKGVDY